MKCSKAQISVNDCRRVSGLGFGHGLKASKFFLLGSENYILKTVDLIQ